MSDADNDPERCPECGTRGEMYAQGMWGCPSCENTWPEGDGLRTDGGTETAPDRDDRRALCDGCDHRFHPDLLDEGGAFSGDVRQRGGVVGLDLSWCSWDEAGIEVEKRPDGWEDKLPSEIDHPTHEWTCSACFTHNYSDDGDVCRECGLPRYDVRIKDREEYEEFVEAVLGPEWLDEDPMEVLKETILRSGDPHAVIEEIEEAFEGIEEDGS